MASVSRIGGRSLAALLPDLRAQRGPVYAALCDAVTTLVLDGRIATETRLPSERELAAALHISRATVTAAYDALRSSGFLASRTGSGSYVTVPPGSRPGPSLARWRSGADASDLIDLSCAALAAPPGVLQAALPAAAAALPRYAESEGYEPAGLPSAACGHREPIHRARPAHRSGADPRQQRRDACARSAAAAADRTRRPGAHRAAHLPRRDRRQPPDRCAHRRGADGRGRRLGRRDDARDAAPDRTAAGLSRPRLPQPDRRAGRRRRPPRRAAHGTPDRHDGDRRRVVRRARVHRRGARQHCRTRFAR